jgi:hypothetical protein
MTVQPLRPHPVCSELIRCWLRFMLSPACCPPITLAGRLYQALAPQKQVLVGVSELFNSCGVHLRILGHTSMTVGTAVQLAWNEARFALVNLPAPRPTPDLRKL